MKNSIKKKVIASVILLVLFAMYFFKIVKIQIVLPLIILVFLFLWFFNTNDHS